MDSVNSSISGGNFYGPVIMGRDIHMPEHGAMAAPVPRMLPFGPDAFVDREAPRGRLDELLAGRDGRSAPRLVLLHGTLGVGKTGLALHWGQARREEFPGGVFYAELTPRGLGRTVPAAAVLESFLGQLGIPVAEMPGTEEALAARFRSLTCERPSLVVLDGVPPGAAAVRHLLPGHPASMVLMTSRFRLGAFAEGRLPERLDVPALDEEACAELFRAVAGEDVPSGDALRTVLRASAGLPYVVRIAAAHAADPVGGGVEELAARIGREHILEVLHMPDGTEGTHGGGETAGTGEFGDPGDPGEAKAARRIFDLAHERLEPALREGFRLLGLHPTPEFPAAFLDELAPGTLRGLHAAGLLEPAGPGRFRMNGVLHGYAATLAATGPGSSAAARRDGLERMIDWYLRRAALAERKISPRWRAGELFPEPDPDRDAGPFATRAAAIAALEADRHTLAALAELPETGPARLCLLAQAVHAMFLDRGHHTLWTAVARLAQEAAADTGDPLMLARMHFELAFALNDRGSAEDLEEARLHYDAARECARRIGHARTESSALEGLGRIAAAQGSPRAAAELYGQARTALAEVEHPRGRALLDYHEGNAASAAGDHERAVRCLASALRAFEAIEDEGNAAKTRLRSAAALLAAGRPEEAGAPLALALEAFADGTLNRADAVLVRGDVRAALGDAQAARADWQTALEAYGSLRSIRAEEARIRLARTGAGSALPDPDEPQD
ncbi:hypothetical protein ACWGDE_04670 [Streptomyces sp. NPDC054956]